MPHSSDPKLIVPFATEGDPMRQTGEHRKKKSWVITQVWSTLLWSETLGGHGLYERADPRLSRRELKVLTYRTAEAEKAL